MLTRTRVWESVTMIDPQYQAILREIGVFMGQQAMPVSLGHEQDMWIVNEPVGEHTDDQPAGYVTQGLILVNDMNAHLFGIDGEWTMPVGSVYRLDGNSPHGTRVPPTSAFPNGLFAFLAWDGPLDEVLEPAEFAVEAMASVHRQLVEQLQR